MAKADPVQTLQAEASCPICLDYFNDPVITQCGHNFCRSCITQSWEGLESDFPCPQCPAVAAQQIILPNRQLSSFVDLAKQMSGKKKESEMSLCEKHQESLKLFCHEDEKPICVVCDRSKDHRSHTVSPIEEAAKEYKAKLKDWVHPLKKRVQAIVKSKVKEEVDYKLKMGELRDQREKILEFFVEMEEFLEQEKHRILRRLEKEKKAELRIIRRKVTEMLKQQTTLRKMITKVEWKCKQPDVDLLQDVQSIVDRCDELYYQRRPDCPERPSTLGCFKSTQVFLQDTVNNLKVTFPEGLKISRIRGFKEDITLDPDTAHPQLITSADWKRVRWTNNVRNVPYRAKRFSSFYCVFGSQGYTSGRHYWEVELTQEGQSWAVGVAKESLSRTGLIEWSPEGGVWSTGEEPDEFQAFTDPITPLDPPEEPKRLGVYLDYEQGRVYLYNAVTMEIIYKYTRFPFTEKLFPFFFLQGGGEMILV